MGANKAKTAKASDAAQQHLDPELTALFASSLGPVKKAARSLPAAVHDRPTSPINSPSPHDETLAKDLSSLDEEAMASGFVGTIAAATNGHGRKRKRKTTEEDIEGKYTNQLAREEAKERARTDHNKRPKHSPVSDNEKNVASRTDDLSDPESVEIIINGQEGVFAKDIPKHESEALPKEHIELEKASRTVFLSNVSTLAIKSKSARKTLLEHLAFSIPLQEQGSKGGIESIRFRSTAFTNSGVPRKAAYAKKELMDTTTKSTHAYAIYSTQVAAREAIKKLNGTTILDRHLRVDRVAHPAQQDHRRCVFVGNLGFVDDESAINAAEDEQNEKRPRKAKEPADLEEGLWRVFGKVGKVESVRVVRDKQTRVGKGFAYVQFEDANSVEKALLYNDKKFPPMLPRIMRVTRAKKPPKKTLSEGHTETFRREKPSTKTYKPRIPSDTQTFAGRAGKLLGRAGAAQVRGGESKLGSGGKQINGIPRTPESIVFEGHRASQGTASVKMGGSGKKQGKPRTRSSRRGAEFKAKGRKK